eukprot:5014953-Alexandrium_andersonii.AAC.1
MHFRATSCTKGTRGAWGFGGAATPQPRKLQATALRKIAGHTTAKRCNLQLCTVGSLLLVVGPSP